MYSLFFAVCLSGGGECMGLRSDRTYGSEAACYRAMAKFKPIYMNGSDKVFTVNGTCVKTDDLIKK